MSRSIKYSNIKFFITFSLILLGQLLFSQTLKDVIDGDHRSEKNSARDKYRHPIETLEFSKPAKAFSVLTFLLM